MAAKKTKKTVKAAKAKKTSKKTAAAKPKKKKVSFIPKGYHTVTMTMNQVDARATIEFCTQAFGAKVRMMMPLPSGKIMHSEITIGDSVVMVSDAVNQPARAGSAWLYVPDVDKTVEKALAAGATLISPAQDMFWGDRCAHVADPAGNTWGITTHIEDVTPAQMRKRSEAALAQMGS